MKIDWKKLKEVREELGISQESLWIEINRTQQTVLNIEKGYTSPQHETIEKIAKYFTKKSKDFWFNIEYRVSDFIMK